MTKQCIQKTKLDLDYQRLFPEVSSYVNIWITSDDESDEEDPTLKDSILYSENICFVISNFRNKREEHINTNYAVTGRMLCVIPHIREDVFKNAQNKHHIQVNNVIKTLFAVSTEKELHESLDTFWSEYNSFNHKNDPFDSNDFIWNSKDITDDNSHLWHQKYSLPSTKVLGFVACRVTSKNSWNRIC